MNIFMEYYFSWGTKSMTFEYSHMKSHTKSKLCIEVGALVHILNSGKGLVCTVSEQEDQKT